jgi:hypothetical protein
MRQKDRKFAYNFDIEDNSLTGDFPRVSSLDSWYVHT